MKTTKCLSSIMAALILLIVVSCQDNLTKEQLTKFQQAELMKTNNIEIAKKLYNYLDKVNLDSVRVLCSPDVKIYYQSGPPASFNDIEPLMKLFYKAFPDYKHGIEDIFAENDKVVIRIDYSGTLIDTFMYIKPSGQKFTYKGIHIFQLSNNKVINWWAVEDELGMMTQLGMELKQKK
jgi:predicted ester cyclase